MTPPTGGIVPDLIRPMLAAPGLLPAAPGWAYEFKFDGVRAITYIQDGRVRVLSRNHNDVTTTYPELAETAQLLGDRRAVVDGEIVALETGEVPSFARLQNRMHVAAPTPALLRAVPVVYYVFDVLYLDGASTLDLPYQQRRRLLAELELAGDVVRVPTNFVDVDGAQVLQAAELAGLEGVVAKRLSSPYRPGRRSSDWTKVPLIRTQEVVVIGHTAGAGRRAGTIGSLLLAAGDDTGVLRYVGHVGTGFTDAALHTLRAQLVPLRRDRPAVPDVPPEHARHAAWVEPALVGEVVFRNWTPDGILRHASWRGLRPDRVPIEARRPPAATPTTGPEPDPVEGAMQTPDGRWRVEVIGRGASSFYRVIHAGNVVDDLDLDGLQSVLGAAGVDVRTLQDVDPAA